MSALESRWARALLRAAVSTGETARVLDELTVMRELVADHGSYFSDPLISPREQESIFRSSLAGAVCGLTVEFLCLLARKRKIRALPAIVKQFEALVRKELDRADIRLRVPFEPSAGLLERLRGYFVQRGLLTEGQKNEAGIEVIIDKSLLGGFVAECGGFVLDESIRARLKDLYIYGR